MWTKAAEGTLDDAERTSLTETMRQSARTASELDRAWDEPKRMLERLS